MRAALLATLALAAAVSVASAQDQPQTGSAQDAAKKNTHQQIAVDRRGTELRHKEEA